MHPLGMALDHHEKTVKIKNAKRRLISVISERQEMREVFFHRDILFVAALQADSRREEFVIDLSGAQFGFYEPVVSWSKYEELRLRTIVETQWETNFGKVKKKFSEESIILGEIGFIHSLNVKTLPALKDG